MHSSNGVKPIFPLLPYVLMFTCITYYTCTCTIYIHVHIIYRLLYIPNCIRIRWHYILNKVCIRKLQRSTEPALWLIEQKKGLHLNGDHTSTKKIYTIYVHIPHDTYLSITILVITHNSLNSVRCIRWTDQRIDNSHMPHIWQYHV